MGCLPGQMRVCSARVPVLLLWNLAVVKLAKKKNKSGTTRKTGLAAWRGTSEFDILDLHATAYL